MVLSHPFRLTTAGQVAVVEDGTSRAHAEALAVLVGTRRGERPLQPLYGTSDPAFDGLDVAEIQAGIVAFGPEGVQVDQVTVTSISDLQAAVTLTFTEEQDLV